MMQLAYAPEGPMVTVGNGSGHFYRQENAEIEVIL